MTTFGSAPTHPVIIGRDCSLRRVKPGDDEELLPNCLHEGWVVCLTADDRRGGIIDHTGLVLRKRHEFDTHRLITDGAGGSVGGR